MLHLAAASTTAPSGPCTWKGTERLSLQHVVPIHDLLTNSFVSRHTRFTSIDTLIDAGELNAKWVGESNVHLGSAWNQFIRSVSDYPDWDAMVRDAGAEWLIRRIGIVIDAS